MNALVKQPDVTAIERIIATGDIGKLDAEQRVQYYNSLCNALGLNPLTRPFEYLTLQGKTLLYARKDCTDQLRRLYDVSVTDLDETEREGVLVVTAKVRNSGGRTDAAKGAVTISGLKGDALANAIMKAETKAKRRATLSICGLGFLDEVELETIPGARPPTARARIAEAAASADPKAAQEAIAEEWVEHQGNNLAKAVKSEPTVCERLCAMLKDIATVPRLDKWIDDYEIAFNSLTPAQQSIVKQALRDTRSRLKGVRMPAAGPAHDADGVVKEAIATGLYELSPSSSEASPRVHMPTTSPAAPHADNGAAGDSVPRAGADPRSPDDSRQPVGRTVGSIPATGASPITLKRVDWEKWLAEADEDIGNLMTPTEIDKWGDVNRIPVGCPQDIQERFYAILNSRFDRVFVK